jgi:hypothetical protein
MSMYYEYMYVCMSVKTKLTTVCTQQALHLLDQLLRAPGCDHANGHSMRQSAVINVMKIFNSDTRHTIRQSL